MRRSWRSKRKPVRNVMQGQRYHTFAPPCLDPAGVTELFFEINGLLRDDPSEYLLVRSDACVELGRPPCWPGGTSPSGSIGASRAWVRGPVYYPPCRHFVSSFYVGTEASSVLHHASCELYALL